MDLIISGALLHDIGKTITYDAWDDTKELKNPTNDYARKFQHSYLGMQIVSEYLKRYRSRTRNKRRAFTYTSKSYVRKQ